MLFLYSLLILCTLASTEVKLIEDLAGVSINPYEGKLDNTLPTVLIHGIHDTCENSGIMRTIELINQTLPQPAPYAECIEIDKAYPKYTSIFDPMTSQTQEYCKLIKNHPKFNSSDINLIGFSQGGLLSRGLV